VGGFAAPSSPGPFLVGDRCIDMSTLPPTCLVHGVAGTQLVPSSDPLVRSPCPIPVPHPEPNTWAMSIGRMSFQSFALDPSTGLLHASNGASFDSR
jgi:hypothetical protein